METGSDWARDSGSHRRVGDDFEGRYWQADTGARVSVAWIGVHRIPYRDVSLYNRAVAFIRFSRGL